MANWLIKLTTIPLRHFIWAGLLTQQLGEERARKYLNAHEDQKNQKDSSNKMDQHNNEKGMGVAVELRFKDKLSLENLENEGLKALKNGELKVNFPQK